MLESSTVQSRDAASIDHSTAIRNWAIALAILGVAFRVYLALTPPNIAMLWDHHEYVTWGLRMVEAGPLHLYDDLPPIGLLQNPHTGKIGPPVNLKQQRANYPPLAAYVLYVKIIALRAVDPLMASNTPAARLCFSTMSIIADLVLAAGCLAIARRLGASPTFQIAAFAGVSLGPPFIIDCAIWGQTDSWVLAPLAWMVWFMMRRRWIVAGLLWGVALGLKTQAVLAAPIWLVALLLARRWKVVGGGLVALLTLFAAGLPFTLASGWGWFDRAFVHNLLAAYPTTTLKAFNLWYVDLMFSENDDASQLLLGLTKDAWGKILLGGALLGATIWAIRRRWRRGSTLVLFSATALLMAVMLPTRVHERYILLPLPFLIAATGLRPRLWWAVTPLMIAATFQLLALHWIHPGGSAESWGYVQGKIHAEYERLRTQLTDEQFSQLPPPRERLAQIRPQFVADRRNSGDPPKEWALTILELTSFLACVVLLITDRQPGPSDTARHRDGDDGG